MIDGHFTVDPVRWTKCSDRGLNRLDDLPGLMDCM